MMTFVVKVISSCAPLFLSTILARTRLINLWMLLMCVILLTHGFHVVLLGYSSLIPKPLDWGYWLLLLIWSVCVLPVWSAVLQRSWGGGYLLWVWQGHKKYAASLDEHSTLISLDKIIPLILSDTNSPSWSSHSLFLFCMGLLYFQKLETEQGAWVEAATNTWRSAWGFTACTYITLPRPFTPIDIWHNRYVSMHISMFTLSLTGP